MEGFIDSAKIFEIVGMISASSFLIIAVGDFFSRSADIIVKKVFAPKQTPFAISVVFGWELLKALYEEFRNFLDKMSAYSRPRLGKEETKK